MLLKTNHEAIPILNFDCWIDTEIDTETREYCAKNYTLVNDTLELNSRHLNVCGSKLNGALYWVTNIRVFNFDLTTNKVDTKLSTHRMMQITKQRIDGSRTYSSYFH